MDVEEELDQAAKTVKDSEDSELFLKFLEAFKAAESEHISKSLNPEDPKDFNLRSANLCAEAYAAADLMIKIINNDLDK